MVHSYKLRLTGVLLALCALSLGLLSGPLALTARAEGTAQTFAVESTLDADGTYHVEQTMTFDGAAPDTLTQRFANRQNIVGERQYVYEITDVKATVGGSDANPSVETSQEETTVTINTDGSSEVVLSYVVHGAVVNEAGGKTALRWRLLQGLSVGVDEFTASVDIPAMFSHVRCTSGPPNSTTPCRSAAGGTEESAMPEFTDGPRGPGETVGIDVGFPAGAVAANEEIDELWTVARAFSAKPLPLGVALGLLLLGGIVIFMLHRRAGVDAGSGSDVIKVAEFTPVGEGQSEFRHIGSIRPGHVGTVVDERVDPIDVTASILDLAVRGHVLITELPRETEFAPADWSFTRRESDITDLHPFELDLLNAIAPEGEEVRVSGMSTRVNEAIGDVQNHLYDEVVSNGWYERRPDETRNRWTHLALVFLILAVVATGVLAAFTSFGLIGLAAVALGLGLVFVAQEMPARTAKGAALLTGLGALRGDILTHSTEQMPPGKELRELSEVLPYAVVLGGAERWLDAIVATDLDDDPDSTDLSWYHGPENWHLQDLPTSLRNFTTTVSGTLFAR
ncbi:MAG: DUF2207 domain-containing protein [Propionibacteriaceae bacterium]